jgi:deazaflavin-dependent oxidoreductase (nitroreductase family)
MRDPRSPVLRVGLLVLASLYKTPFRRFLGTLYMSIRHRGRRTGRTYQTLVTVLHRDQESGEIFVTSSMQGERADWYRNLKAHPPLEVQVGKSHFEVTHRFLTEDERSELYRRVCGQKPVRARLGLFVTGHRWLRSDDDFDILARNMPAVAFKAR